jgi:hypothetical protein
MRKGMILAVVGLWIVIGLVACGGGGGGGNQLPSIALKTSSLRISQPNDSLTYSVSGTWNQSGSNYSVTGTYSDIITTTTITSPVSNTQCKIDATSLNITVNNVPVSANSFNYFTQDGSGNQYTYGEGDGSTNKWITSPIAGYVKEIISPMAVGDSLSYNVTYDNGDTESSSYVVTAKEYVSTAIANYESYKVNVTQTTNYASGTTTKEVQNINAWVVPGLGIVKENINIIDYAGSTITDIVNLTTTLSATNISY